MDRQVEVEDVADIGDVEAARRDIGGDEQLQLVVAKALQHGHARALVHVPVQCARIEIMLDQRAEQFRHVAFAVAEDDGVLQFACLFFRADDVAQLGAPVPVLRAALDEALCHRFGG